MYSCERNLFYLVVIRLSKHPQHKNRIRDIFLCQFVCSREFSLDFDIIRFKFVRNCFSFDS